MESLEGLLWKLKDLVHLNTSKGSNYSVEVLEEFEKSNLELLYENIYNQDSLIIKFKETLDKDIQYEGDVITPCVRKVTIVPQKEKISNDVHIFQIICEFLEYALKAIVILNESKLNYLFENQEKIVYMDLPDIFHSMPMNLLSSIFLHIVSQLLDDVVDNPVLINLINRLHNHQETSVVLSAALLTCISETENFRILENTAPSNPKSLRAKRYLSLIDDILLNFKNFPEVPKNTIKHFLHQFIRISMDIIPGASNPSNYFYLLKVIITNLHPNEQTCDCDSYLFSMIDLFNRWLETSWKSEESVWYIFLDLILSVFSIFIEHIIKLSTQKMEDVVLFLIKTVIFSLKGCENLVSKALIFLNMLHERDLKYIEMIPSTLKDDLVYNLYISARCSYSSHDNNEKASEILGKLGPRNRDLFSKPQKLKKSEVEVPCIHLLLYNLEDFIAIPFNYLDFAFNAFIDPDIDLDIKKKWWHIVKLFLETYIRTDFSNCFDLDYGNEGFKKLLYTAFKIMFVASESPCVSDTAEKFMENFLGNIFSFDIFLFQKSKNINLSDILLDSLMDVMCLSKDSFEEIYMNSFKSVAKFINNSLETQSIRISCLMFKKIVILCSKSSIKSKFVACKVFEYLFEESSYMWKVTHIPDILSALLSMVTSLERKISFGVTRIARNLLLKKVLYCKPFEPDTLNDGINITLKKVMKILCDELFSATPNTRKEARLCIYVLSRVTKKSVSDLIQPFDIRECVPTLLTLFEDFEFGNKLKKTIHDWKHAEVKVVQFLHKCLLQSEIIEREIHECCAALHAITLNFINEHTINDFIKIIYLAMQSEISKISETGFKCLHFIWMNLNDISKILSEEFVNNVHHDFLKHIEYCSPIEKSDIYKLSIFFKLFRTYPIEDTLEKCLAFIKDAIITHKRGDEPMLSKKLDAAAYLITVLRKLPNTDISLIPKVIQFVTEIENHWKQININNPLRQPLVKFCQINMQFALETVRFFIASISSDLGKRKIFFEVFLDKKQGNIFRYILGEDDHYRTMLFTNLDLHYMVQALGYLNQYNENLVSDKHWEMSLLYFKWSSYVVNDIFTLRTYITMTKCLMNYYNCNVDNFNILFSMIKVLKEDYHHSFEFLKCFLFKILDVKSSFEWKIKAVTYFPEWLKEKETNNHIFEILRYFFIPLFFAILNNGEKDELQMILKEFLNYVDDLFQHSVKVQVLLLKFSSVIAQNASDFREPFMELCMSKIKEHYAENMEKPLVEESLYLNYLLLSVIHPCNGVLLKLLKFAKFQSLINIMIDMVTVTNNMHVFVKVFKSNISMESMIPENLEIMNFILKDPKLYSSIQQVFSSAFFKLLIQPGNIKMSIELLEVIFVWRVEFSTDLEKEELLKFLFKTTCNTSVCDDNLNKDFLLDKCKLLLKDTYCQKLFNSVAIDIEFWLSDLLTCNLNDNQSYMKIQRICQMAFDIIDDMLPFLNVATLISFIRFLRVKLYFILDFNNMKIIQGICSMISKLKEMEDLENMELIMELISPIQNIISSADENMYCSIFMLLEAIGIVYIKKSSLFEEMKKLFSHISLKFDQIAMCSVFELLDQDLLFYKILPYWINNIDDSKYVHKVFEIFKFSIKSILKDFKYSIFKITIPAMKCDLYIRFCVDDIPNELYNKSYVDISEFCKKMISMEELADSLYSKILSHTFNDEKNLLINNMVCTIIDIMETIESWRLYLQRTYMSTLEYVDAFTEVFENLPMFKYEFILTSNMFSCNFEVCQVVFNYFVKKDYDNVNSSLLGIFNRKLKVNYYHCWSAQFIHIICINIKDVCLIKKEEGNIELVKMLFVIVELCYKDSSLADHIWPYIFEAIWKNMRNLKQGLFESMIPFIEFITAKNDLDVNQIEVFIIPAIKCAPELCLFINPKLLKKSMRIQVQCILLLQNHIHLVDNEDAKRYMNLLTYVCYNLEENDQLYSCLLSNSYSEPEIVEAVCQQLDGKLSEAATSYEEAYKNLRLLNQPYDKYICKFQYRRCLKELQVWNANLNDYQYTSLNTFNSMKYIWSSLKWEVISQILKTKFDEQTALENYCHMQSFQNVSQDCLYPDTLSQIISESSNKWKSLPGSFLSNNHKSLLMMFEQFTEYKEILNIINCYSVTDCMEKIRRFDSSWDTQKYLLNDDISFIIEKYNFRLFVYQFIMKCKKISDLNVLREIQEMKNKLLLQFASAICNHKKLADIHGVFDDSSMIGFDVIKFNLSSLLLLAKKPLSFQRKEKLYEEACFLMLSHSTLINKLCENKRLSLETYKEFLRELSIECDQTRDSSMKALATYSENHDKIEDQNLMVTLKWLFEACKSGDQLLLITFITRTLNALKHADKNQEDVKQLILYLKQIRPNYLLPFLPVLFANYFEFSKANDMSSEVSKQIKNEYQDLCFHLCKKYPQEMFFSIQNIKNGSEDSEETLIICDQLINKLKDYHANLIKVLIRILEDFSLLKSKYYETEYHKLGLILEKLYYFIHDILKNDDNILNPYIFDKCKDFVIKEFQKESICFSSNFKHLVESLIPKFERLETLDDVVSLLKNTFNKYCVKYLPGHLFLKDVCKFLPIFAAYGINLKIFPMEKSLYEPTQSNIHILEFCPEVHISKWDNYFAHKLRIRGTDGQIYSCMIMEYNNSKSEETSVKLMEFLNILNTVFLDNVNCSKKYLKHHLPNIMLISQNLKLLPYGPKDDPITYFDICRKFALELKDCSIDTMKLYFKSIFHKNFRNIESMTFYGFLKFVPENSLSTWMYNLYSDPLNYFHSKKEFIRHLSLLLSAEFLNLSTEGHILIDKNTSVVSPYQLQFKIEYLKDYERKKFFSNLITPNTVGYLNSCGFTLLIENLLVMSIALQENKQLITQLLCIFSDFVSCKDPEISENALKKININRNDLKCEMEYFISRLELETFMKA